ncbi:MAG: tRNA-dihydrouridine synthase [[Clostridium] scindens]
MWDQFFASATGINGSDEYGGTVKNRTRFAKEIIEAVKKGCAGNMPVLFRISMDHRTGDGRGIEDSIEIIKELEKEGVDAFDVDAGSYETIDYIFPTAYLGDACMAYTARAAKEAVSVPILNAGNHTPETAKELIENKDADFVMIGRGLIADPDLPKKLRDDRREDIRPCIRCNEDCIGRTAAFKMAMLALCGESRGMPGTAVVSTWRRQCYCSKRVCVIGAGPGG